MSDDLSELRAQLAASQQSPSNNLASIILSVLLATGAGVGSSAGVSHLNSEDLEDQIRVLERQVDGLQAKLDAERQTFQYRLQNLEDRVRGLGRWELRLPPQSKAVNPKR